MRSYRCEVRRQGVLSLIFCIALLFFALAAFFFSRYLGGNLRAVGQGLAVVLLVLFIQISSRFFLTAYAYLWEDGHLSLSSRTGRRIKSLGSLPVTGDCLLLKKAQWQKRKKEFSLSHRFSYCQNLFPQDSAILLFPDREKGGYVLLEFEPDETLFSLLREVTQS